MVLHFCDYEYDYEYDYDYDTNTQPCFGALVHACKDVNCRSTYHSSLKGGLLSVAVSVASAVASHESWMRAR